MPVDKAWAVLEASCASGELCGAVAGVVSGDVVAMQAFGHSSQGPGGTKLGLDAIFDLASLTKVVATLPCILQAVGGRDTRLDHTVSDFLPELEGTAPGQATLFQLLTHTSGLPAHHPFYRETPDRAGILRVVAGMPLATRGEVVYSDIGFILLGWVVEALAGAGLDRVAGRRVFVPLGMVDTAFGAGAGTRVVATELGVPLGVVHDENARSMGGVAGHAGLFSTISDLAKYVQVWMNGGRKLLSPALAELATRDCTGGQGRGLGWLIPGPDSVFPRAGYGHTGFTGTSLWIYPPSRLAVVLLTNAVHPTRGNPATPRIRREFHRAVWDARDQRPGGEGA